MSVIVGIDFSTNAIDAVALQEETDRADHHRLRLDTGPGDALQRIRRIRDVMPSRGTWSDRGALLVAIEKPYSAGAGRGSDSLQYALGAIVASIDLELRLELIRADDWRKELGLPIRKPKRAPASFHKTNAIEFAREHWIGAPDVLSDHAADGFCIAWAARARL